MDIRVGHGYDVHKIIGNRQMIMGGVEIDSPFGLEAHSDGDVLVHALMDAILGACALGDIGRHFPDNSSEYKNISSLELLKRVLYLTSGWKIGNIDCTIIAQRPKFARYIEAMRMKIAETAGCSADKVNIKATTEEGLGFTGRQEGIAAHAVVLMIKE